MAEAKRKTTARKKATTRQTMTRKTAAKTAETSAKEASIQTTSGAQSGPVRVEAGGIDPRLVEERERRRAEESTVRVAVPSEPYIDPRLVEIRDKTIAREAELADRSTTKPPTRG